MISKSFSNFYFPKKKKKLTTVSYSYRSEAASLVFRFHDAGWIHGSIAKRNILIQPGPLSEAPLSRHINSGARGGHGIDWSFRLIDFGRSYKIIDRPALEREKLVMQEEIDIQNWIFLNGNLG
jgi:hypothetical protein